VKLRVFYQGSRRDFCLRNSILILQVVVSYIALKARVPRQRKVEAAQFPFAVETALEGCCSKPFYSSEIHH
jgi:hypothetical protein